MAEDGCAGDKEVEMKMSEACGLFGCVKSKSAALEAINVPETVRSGLEQLQHRGNESSGIIGSMGSEGFLHVKDTGLVRSVFTPDRMRTLDGCTICIGHNRYSTAGLKDGLTCVQPFLVHTVVGQLAIAHNGQLVHADHLRDEILNSGVALSTDTDSELIAHIIAGHLAEKKRGSPANVGTDGFWIQVLRKLVEELELSYSLLLLIRDRIFAIRDPWGNRPLCVGSIRDSTKSDMSTLGYVVSSETCAFACIGAKFEREVLPGQIVELSPNGIKYHSPEENIRNPRLSFCIFEFIYFARPDSQLQGENVKEVRERCGERLGKEGRVEADIVTTVPDSATPAAEGYAQQTGIPFKTVLYKNGFIGRSFIQPNTALRQSAVRRKFGVFRSSVEGKRVVLVDDSIVRGNTMGPIVKLLKENGATQVHIRVASPPIRHPCYYGINIPQREELIATKLLENSSPAELSRLAAHFNADSVQYLSLDGLKMAVNGGKEKKAGQCTGCLDGSHPVLPNGQSILDF